MQPLPRRTPQSPASARPLAPGERRPPSGAPSALSRLTGRLHGVAIALAGNDPLERLGTARALRAEGATVHVLERPDANLRALGGSLRDLDMLVTDMRLRESSGPRLARDLWRAKPDLPVLYLCSSSRDTLGFMAGPEDRSRLLFRPFDESALARTIREHLDELRSGQAPTSFPRTL